jgi:hypothetical protein
MLDIKGHIALNAILYAVVLFAASYIYKSSPIEQNNVKTLIVFAVAIMGLSLFLTPMTLMISAKQKCGKPKPGFEGEVIGRGVLVGIMTYIVFMAFNFISIIREPFVAFLGHQWYAYGVGLAFYCSMAVITFVTVNYFDGLRSACKIPVSQCLENIKPYLESQRYLTEEDVAEDEELSSDI